MHAHTQEAAVAHGLNHVMLQADVKTTGVNVCAAFCTKDGVTSYTNECNMKSSWNNPARACEHGIQTRASTSPR